MPVATRVADEATVALARAVALGRAVVVGSVDGVAAATAGVALVATLGVPTTGAVAVRVTMATAGVPPFTLAVGVGAVARSLKKKVKAATKIIVAVATARYCGCK